MSEERRQTRGDEPPPGEADSDGPAFTPLDLGICLGLAPLALAALLVPPRGWPRFAHLAARLSGGGLARDQGQLAERIRAVAGARALATTPEQAARALTAKEIEKHLLLMRDHLTDSGWLRSEVSGATHLDAALAAGQGAVLWVSHFQFGAMVTKIALHRAGYRLVHLSHPRHGFSDSAFGRKVLNPIVHRAENRYLAERVLLSPASPVGAMRTLVRRLRENALVSVTVRPTGAQPVTVPFMEARWPLATGAPDLAHRTGAALLPVFTTQAADGGYRVVVEAPIPVPSDAPRHAAAQAAAAEYSRRLEPHVLAAPGQWLGWVAI